MFQKQAKPDTTENPVININYKLLKFPIKKTQDVHNNIFRRARCSEYNVVCFYTLAKGIIMTISDILFVL